MNIAGEVLIFEAKPARSLVRNVSVEVEHIRLDYDKVVASGRLKALGFATGREE